MKNNYSKIRKDDGNYQRFKKNKLFYRSRGLEELQSRFNEDINRIISDASKTSDKIRVLEIGFGEGKALLEACSIHKNIYGYGINDKKRPTVSSSNDVIKNAKKFGLQVYQKPKIYFYDAGNGLKFPENYFDIVFSQVAIHYVGDKLKLFEEIWRTLKTGGYAFLHIDNALTGEQPGFMYNYKDTPRLVIYNKNKAISTKTFFNKLKQKGFDLQLNIRKDNKNNITLVIHKNTNKKINTNLKYDGNSTIYLTPLKDSDKYKFDSAIWWGTRSVYRLK